MNTDWEYEQFVQNKRRLQRELVEIEAYQKQKYTPISYDMEKFEDIPLDWEEMKKFLAPVPTKKEKKKPKTHFYFHFKTQTLKAEK